MKRANEIIENLNIFKHEVEVKEDTAEDAKIQTTQSVEKNASESEIYSPYLASNAPGIAARLTIVLVAVASK